MKRSTKIALGIGGILLGSLVLTGCTASFCTNEDKAHILYLYDGGSTFYSDSPTHKKTVVSGDDVTEIDVANEPVSITYNGTTTTTAAYSYVDVLQNATLVTIYSTANTNGYATPSANYWKAFDQIVLNRAYAEYLSAGLEDYVLPDVSSLAAEDIKVSVDNYSYETLGLLDKFGYVKYSGVNEKNKVTLWVNWEEINDEILTNLDTYGLTIDETPTLDFINLYKKTMNSYVASARACIAIKSGLYGSYGPNSLPAEISVKKWTDWKGLLEFLFVWPLGALIDVITTGFLGAGMMNGWAQLFAILIVTVLVRSLMLLVTFKQTKNQAKMTALQPEIAKIQAKYPNSNTNQYEKQMVAQETQKLYKKNKINPLTSLLVMVIQFPVFICVYGAISGSAWLSTGSVLGLKLSSSISSVLFNAAGWKNGSAITALVLFLLMAAAQTIAMLLPNILQKKRNKNVQKLGKNPAQDQQGKGMKYFTYIMLAMIIIMGFSLASAIGVYWVVGALFSIAQTLIMNRASLKANAKNKK